MNLQENSSQNAYESKREGGGLWQMQISFNIVDFL
jgi:hypothetical protein